MRSFNSTAVLDLFVSFHSDFVRRKPGAFAEHMTLIWGGRRHAQQGAFRIASGLFDSRSLFVPFKDFVTCDVVERAVGDDMTVFRIVCSHLTRFIHVCVVSSHSFGCLGSFIGCMSCHVNSDFDFLLFPHSSGSSDYTKHQRHGGAEAHFGRSKGVGGSSVDHPGEYAAAWQRQDE